MQRFALTAIVVALTVLALGWFTDLRGTLYHSLLGLTVVALLPFLLLATFLVFGIGASVLFALVPDLGIGNLASDALVDGAMESAGVRSFVRRYYRFLERQRHPLFWGTLAGVLLGALLCFAVLALFVLPGDSRTLDALGAASLRIEQAYDRDGAYPRPVDGTLVLDDATVRDGFGRPLVYAVKDRGPLHSWTLRSLGYDGRDDGADDLCMDGGNRLSRVADAVGRTADAFSAPREKSPRQTEHFAALRAARCARPR